MKDWEKNFGGKFCLSEIKKSRVLMENLRAHKKELGRVIVLFVSEDKFWPTTKSDILCLMNIKERGWGTGLAISVFILFFSFGVAFVLNWILTGWGVAL